MKGGGKKRGKGKEPKLPPLLDIFRVRIFEIKGGRRDYNVTGSTVVIFDHVCTLYQELTTLASRISPSP